MLKMMLTFTIPNSTIKSLNDYKSSIDELFRIETNKRYEQIYNELSRNIQCYLAKEIFGVDIITKTTNYFTLDKHFYDNYGKPCGYEFGWQIDNYQFIIVISKYNNTRITLCRTDICKTLHFTENLTWQPSVNQKTLHGCFDKNLLTSIPLFVSKFLPFKKFIIKQYGKLLELYEYYPILQTKDTIMCLFLIRIYRDSVLSLLPIDIIYYIAKILWNDRYNLE